MRPPQSFRSLGAHSDGLKYGLSKSFATETSLASFCRKTYKLLINQEKPIIQDQTSDKLERRSGCGFPARRRSGESNCSLPSRSGLVGKLRVAGQRAEPPDWELNRKFSEGSDSGLSR